MCFDSLIVSLLLAGAEILDLSSASASETVVEDVLGRRLNERGITLVDRDGYMANPLVTIYVIPPADAVFSATVVCNINGERLYFDNPTRVTSSGPTKTVVFRSSADRIPIKLSIFPDRDGQEEEYLFTITFTSGNNVRMTNTIPVRVLDQDLQRPNEFPVIVNFERDVTGFFTNELSRVLTQQAAEDWAYFFADMGLDSVPKGAESTYIWYNNFNGGYYFANTNSYQGYQLYAYGTTNQLHRSGGEGNFNGPVQRSGGKPLDIKRSGGFEAEIHGNYNTLGWLFLTNDSQWLLTGNLGHETNDFYSIAHHEIGHALIFNVAHPGFDRPKKGNGFQSAAVTNYFGGPVRIDVTDHLNGVIDPESGQGAFGYEYFGVIPRKRWLITKLDILCAQEVGYALRDNSAFASLALGNGPLPVARSGVAYSTQLPASGGIPIYDFTVMSGGLPPGVELDRFTGRLSGTPSLTGPFNFTVKLRDYEQGSNGVTHSYLLEVAAAPLLTLSVESVERVGIQQTVHLLLDGSGSIGEVIEASPDLLAWTAIVTNLSGGNPLRVTETNELVRSRYYRAVETRQSL